MKDEKRQGSRALAAIEILGYAIAEVSEAMAKSVTEMKRVSAAMECVELDQLGMNPPFDDSDCR